MFASLDARHDGLCPPETFAARDGSVGPVAYFAASDRGRVLGVRSRAATAYEAADWMGRQRCARAAMAGLLGCDPDEVVAANVDAPNLDAVIARFYQPVPPRRAMLTEWTAGALVSRSLRALTTEAGYDPERFVARIRPRWDESRLRAEDVVDFVQRYGHEYSVVLLTIGVDVICDPTELTAVIGAAHRAGCAVGVDATALVGIVPLSLHDWGVDFAVWRTDRHLCSGNADDVGLYVHSRHHLSPHGGVSAWVHPTRPNWYLEPFYAFVEQLSDMGIETASSRTADLKIYLGNQLANVFGVDAVERIDRVFTTDVALRIGAGAASLADRLRVVHNVLASTRGENVLTLTPNSVYNTVSDCDRAVAALRAELKPAQNLSATSPKHDSSLLSALESEIS